MTFTRGTIIMAILVLSLTVSFFLGKMLGDELMSSGREQLQAFTGSEDGSSENPNPLGGNQPQSDYEYKGVTEEKFPANYTPPEGETSATAAVTIEPVGEPSDPESTESAGSDSTDIFSLDSGSSIEEPSRLFRVQVGVFTDQGNADTLSAGLRKESFGAYTQEVKDDKDATWWKVYVGPFKTLQDAQKAAEDLRSRNYDCYVQ